MVPCSHRICKVGLKAKGELNGKVGLLVEWDKALGLLLQCWLLGGVLSSLRRQKTTGKSGWKMVLARLFVQSFFRIQLWKLWLRNW